MRLAILIIVSLFVRSLALGQSFNEKISRSIGFEKRTTANAVIVANMNGNISVVGYDGDQVILEAEKIIQAKTEDRLQKGKEQIQLGVIDRADTLIFYTAGGCAQFMESNDCSRFNGVRWGYSCEHFRGKDDHCQELFDYKMNFVLKVPFYVHLHLSTVNGGDISVQNAKGIVSAHNVNGSINLANLTKKANARTINGNVDITYDHNPESDCRFYTLNGNINASFQKGLDGNLSFESFNGNFFSNVDLEKLPPQLIKNNSANGIKYKLKGSRYKIGTGVGAHLDFETFNGNVYLKEKTN